jgi:hypothetical protein
MRAYLRQNITLAEGVGPQAGAAVREALASAMMRCSLATGHGDSFESLLTEMEGQVQRLQSRLSNERVKSYNEGFDSGRASPPVEREKIATLADLITIIDGAMNEWENEQEASNTNSCAQHIALATLALIEQPAEKKL